MPLHLCKISTFYYGAVLLPSLFKNKGMKKITMILKTVVLCLLLASGSNPLMAQDAINKNTSSDDSSDWGLLGLLGLIGLLGLKKKERDDDINLDKTATPTTRAKV